MHDSLLLKALDRCVRVEADDPSTLQLVGTAYAQMRSEDGEPDRNYRFLANAEATRLVCDDEEVAWASDSVDLLWELDGDLVVELQKLRRELFFVHAAVVAHADRAYALVAESGGGKSSLCWALLFEGFGYMSDELCPVDLRDLSVQPFPRALSLKFEPAAPLGVPERVLRTPRAVHVPVTELPAPTVTTPLPLDAVFCMSYDPSHAMPEVRPISTATAATRLFVSALNPLAHPADGLDAAIGIAKSCRCYEVVSADLRATSELVSRTIREDAGAA